MYSVTKRISMIKQPRGGYINKKELVVTQLDDGITLNDIFVGGFGFIYRE